MDADPPIRIYLSPPHVGEVERELLLDAFDSNWIAPLGPHVDAFEREMADYLGNNTHCVALSSGTAALHLALVDLGVRPGDEIITSTLTFVATANAISYVGATPVFVDVDPKTWQLDPDIVEDAIRTRVGRGRPPAAVVTVDLYGHCADHDPIVGVCREFGIPVVEDAAEALGATYKGRPAGTLGDIGVFSFNGNKIITTSGGGMLVTTDPDRAARARSLAAQARDSAPHYEHSSVGFNYRLSNLLAAIGRGQLSRLDSRIERRRSINGRYRELLSPVVGIEVAAEPPHVRSNAWLTCITVDADRFGATARDIWSALRRHGIESRPIWKPMHLQPMFAGTTVEAPVAADVFSRGLCLPSGSTLDLQEVDEIVDIGFKSVRRV